LKGAIPLCIVNYLLC